MGSEERQTRELIEEAFGIGPPKPNGKFSVSGETAEAGIPAGIIESYPVFADRVSKLPQLKEIVTQLHCENSLNLSHGQPRDGKTLFEQQTALTVALGGNVLGLERFHVPEPRSVCYLTEEDSERRTLERLDAMLAGLCLAKRPDNLFLAVRRGVNLDDSKWQRYLIDAAKDLDFCYMVVDPLRAFTQYADQGPSDLKPLVLFLRRFINETGCSVRLVHHDTKPQSGKADDRKRAQRASGGGIFSIADSPLSFERLNDSQTLVVPSGFKFLETPAPFRFTIKAVNEGGRLVSLQLIGEDIDVDDAASLALEERILQLLKESPGGMSGNSITKACRARRESVSNALDRLFEAGNVDSVKRGKTVSWFLRGVSGGGK
jgi:hypothetical protein